MANVLIFHHVLGLTAGMDAFADVLRDAGHTVTMPDLFDGRTFSTLDDGVEYAEEVGFDVLEELGVSIAERMPPELVYVGFSLGVMPAQRLAQTRAGARGAVLVSSCVPPGTFAPDWPLGVPLQVHGMEDDPHFVDEGDLDAARNLVDSVLADSPAGVDAIAELTLYPGDGHFFADISSPDYDEDAAHALTAGVLRLLSDVDAA